MPKCDSIDFFVLSLRGWRDESDRLRPHSGRSLINGIDAIQRSASDLSRMQGDQTSAHIVVTKYDSLNRYRD